MRPFNKLMACVGLAAAVLFPPAAAAGPTVKVAGVVLKWVRGDKEANFRRAEPLIRQAAAGGARIICTTECFLDGYAIADKSIPLDDYRRLGEPIPDGPYFRRLAALAGELKIHLVAGFLEADGEHRYNTAVLLGPDGKLAGKYRKQKLGHESVRNTAGNESSVFDTPYGRVGIMICADRTEPGIVRGFCAKGADVLLCPSGGMFGPKTNDPIVQSRSRENKVPIVFVHPAEFLVTGPDGSVLDRTLLGDVLLVAKGQVGGAADTSRVFFFDLPVRQTPSHKAELVFPLHPQHNHAPGIAECPNGDLLVSWYRGSGERSADDVAVYGARLRKGSERWSDAFLMADFPGFPDCNTALHLDDKGRLWLFWPTILANTWQSCLTNYRVSRDYQGDGPPKWEGQGVMYLRPQDFEAEMRKGLEARVKMFPDAPLRAELLPRMKELIGDKLSGRLGWQPRCKPTVLPSGRILLPLYSDTYSACLMAISDDGGRSWYAGKPMAGFGAIQAAVLSRGDGTLVAYMRENGPIRRVRVAESKDDGITWGPVGATALPNPGSGLDAVRLADGTWALVYNDTVKGRSSLAVSLSDDEGRSWKWTRHLERHDAGSYHYPAIIQGKDGTIHAVYSYFVKEGKSMKHAAFDAAWVKQGDPK